jgi:hypothetical protein
MIDNDIFVIDGIIHPFDLSPRKRIGDHGETLVTNLIGAVTKWCPPGTTLGDQAGTDYPLDGVNGAVFLESATDMAVTHHVPLYTFVQDGLVTVDRNQEIAAKWPDRYLVYAGVDPTQGVSAAIESLERQVELIPQTIGLKLYPVQVDTSGKVVSHRMDDERLFPIWERARDLGIKVIAEHKLSTYGPFPINPFRVEDMAGAARAFPDLAFEVIHGGIAFTEETASLIARFPNVYANLESTSALLHQQPKRFEAILAELIDWGGHQKVLWGTGGPIIHPQPLLELFMDFQFSDHTLDTTDLTPLTREQKRDILGGNFARMAGLDIQQAKAKIENDEFEKTRHSNGLAAPYSHWN